MVTYKLLPKALIIVAILTSPISIAQSKTLPDIAVIDSATIFADFRDELPAVVNYYTKHSEADIINFYQKAYGEPLSQERKRGRLLLKYQHGDNKVRVIISTQNNRHQVDVIVQ